MRLGLFGLALIAATSTALTSVPVIRPAPMEIAPDVATPMRRRRADAGGMAIRRRSKGAQAKPRKRPNRMHVSRRARRRHRRAA